jgi:DNA-binding MarR family transcriptional regulator
MTRKTASASRSIDLDTMPGHGMRRLQQIAVALFMQEAVELGATPVQYAVLHTLGAQPGVDQRTLARLVSLDTSTIAGVIDRLEARGLLTRSLSAEDRRVRLLNLTAEGEALLAQLVPLMLRAQERILDPLSAAERKTFMRMMRTVVNHHAQLGASSASES